MTERLHIDHLDSVTLSTAQIEEALGEYIFQRTGRKIVGLTAVVSHSINVLGHRTYQSLNLTYELEKEPDGKLS